MITKHNITNILTKSLIPASCIGGYFYQGSLEITVILILFIGLIQYFLYKLKLKENAKFVSNIHKNGVVKSIQQDSIDKFKIEYYKINASIKKNSERS